MSTPSAPEARAFITKLGSTRPLHITRMTRTLGAYLMRAVPARSAARYEHQLQQKPTILGSKFSLAMGVVVGCCRVRSSAAKTHHISGIALVGLRCARPHRTLSGRGGCCFQHAGGPVSIGVPEGAFDLGKNLFVIEVGPGNHAGR